MYKITVTDEETGVVVEEDVAECIIAGVASHIGGKVDLNFIKAYASVPITIACCFTNIMKEMDNIINSNIAIAMAMEFVKKATEMEEWFADE